MYLMQESNRVKIHHQLYSLTCTYHDQVVAWHNHLCNTGFKGSTRKGGDGGNRTKVDSREGEVS